MARPTRTSDEAVLAAVAAHPQASAAEIADLVGMGQSTAAKRLTALEIAGSVRRIPGGREKGRRVPDRWARVSGTKSAKAPSKTSDTSGKGKKKSSAARLGRGELGSLVRDFLGSRPDESFGPAAVGKALGHSQGAISNALATMAANGDVVLASDKPRRYRIATAKE